MDRAAMQVLVGGMDVGRVEWRGGTWEARTVEGRHIGTARTQDAAAKLVVRALVSAGR